MKHLSRIQCFLQKEWNNAYIKFNIYLHKKAQKIKNLSQTVFSFSEFNNSQNVEIL